MPSLLQTLKRKERECEHEMERLAREKIANQQRLAQLKRDLSAKWDHIDFSQLLPDPSANNDNDSNSTLSAAGELGVGSEAEFRTIRGLQTLSDALG